MLVPAYLDCDSCKYLTIPISSLTYNRRACKVYGDSIDVVLLTPRVGHKEIGQLFSSKSIELSMMQGGRTGKSRASVNSIHTCKLKVSLCMQQAFVSYQCIYKTFMMLEFSSCLHMRRIICKTTFFCSQNSYFFSLNVWTPERFWFYVGEPPLRLNRLSPTLSH